MPNILPPQIERSLRAQALLPSNRRTLDFFSDALAKFQSSDTPFRVICTHQPPIRGRGGPQHALQNRILAPQISQQPPHPEPVPPRTRPGSLVVLDASFNPPTKAHLRMARSAVRGLRRKKGPSGNGGGGGAAAAGGAVRLLLVLGVANADKGVAPAALEQRLSMMWAFAKDLRGGLREDEQQSDDIDDGDDDGVSIDVCLSRRPYFHEKSEAIARSEFYNPADDGGQERPEQVFLVGYDTLIRILNPKYYGTTETGEGGDDEPPIQRALNPFFGRARLLVTMRADAEWGDKDEQSAYVENLSTGDGLKKAGGNPEWAQRIAVVDGQQEGGLAVSSTLAREAAKRKDQERLRELVTPGVKKWVEGEGLYAEAQ